ncbi:DUF305 domain-containing protein [Thioalkalivibrio thiocyanodenitrificans]|uniref:DUF305 domain-containing protein n=1 Tax=Thioalkalivibrio thiocyanodenitrificans TaxID=243063 RepID=UPI0009FF779B
MLLLAGAVGMAEAVLRYGGDPEIRKCAREIIADRKEEIGTMRRWASTKNHRICVNDQVFVKFGPLHISIVRFPCRFGGALSCAPRGRCRKTQPPPSQSRRPDRGTDRCRDLCPLPAGGRCRSYFRVPGWRRSAYLRRPVQAG